MLMQRQLRRFISYGFLGLLLLSTASALDSAFSGSQQPVRMYYVIHPTKAMLKKDPALSGAYYLIIENPSLDRVTDRPYKIEKAIDVKQFLLAWSEHLKRYGKAYDPTGMWVFVKNKNDEVRMIGIKLKAVEMKDQQLILKLIHSDFDQIPVVAKDFEKDPMKKWIDVPISNSNVHINFR